MSKYTHKVWDGISTVNGISATEMRKEYGMAAGQLAYMLFKDGRMTHFQAWNPFESGFVTMSAGEIDSVAERHVNQEIGREAEYIASLTDGRIINLANSTVLEYNFGTGAPHPFAVTLDNPNLRYAKTMYIAANTMDDIDVKGVLAMIEPGSRLQIREKLSGIDYAVFRVNERPVVGTGNLTIDVTYLFGEGDITESRVLLNVMPAERTQGERRIVHEFSHRVPPGVFAGRQTMQAHHPARRMRDTTFAVRDSSNIHHKFSSTNSKEVVYINHSGQIWEGNLETSEFKKIYDMGTALNAQGACDICYHEGKYYFVMATQTLTLFILDEKTLRLTQAKMPLTFNRIFGVANGSIILHNNTANTQVYAYNIETGLVSMLNAKPAGQDLKWDGAAFEMYNVRLYAIGFGTSALSWYYDFATEIWVPITTTGIPQLTRSGDTAVDHSTGDFYAWQNGRVDRINLNTLEYSGLGTVEWPTAAGDRHWTGLYYKGLFTTFNRQFTLAQPNWRLSNKFPWSGFPNGRYKHDTEDWLWYFSPNGQIYRVSWVNGIIKVVWSVVRQATDMYSQYGGLSRCMALAERNGWLYIAGQYPFMVNTETGEGRLITVGGVAVSGPTAGEASFAARLGDEIAMAGVGIASENASFNRVIKVSQNGTADYCPSNWVNTSTDTNYNLIVYEEEGLVSRAPNAAASISRYNLLGGIANTATNVTFSTTAGLKTFYNYRTKAWYALFDTDISLANEGTLLLPAAVTGWTAGDFLSLYFNPDKGYAIDFVSNLIFTFPESVCVQKVGRVRKGQTLEFSAGGSGANQSCMMVNGKRYTQGRHIMEEDGYLWSCVYPGGAAADRCLGAKWLNGWVEEA